MPFPHGFIAVKQGAFGKISCHFYIFKESTLSCERVLNIGLVTRF